LKDWTFHKYHLDDIPCIACPSSWRVPTEPLLGQY
jgi:hypothetical protein